MADIKKCPKCGGSVHTKIAGNYICSQCGNAIPENEVITVSDSYQASSSDSSYTEFASSASRAGNPGASSDSSYTDFSSAQSETPKNSKPKKEKVKKEKKMMEKKEKMGMKKEMKMKRGKIRKNQGKKKKKKKKEKSVNQRKIQIMLFPPKKY